MDLGLKGKVAMVAGASRGLGFAVAETLAREGARVSIASTDQKAISAAVEQIQRGGGETTASVVDVRRADQIARWAETTTSRFGGVPHVSSPGQRPCTQMRHREGNILKEQV